MCGWARKQAVIAIIGAGGEPPRAVSWVSSYESLLHGSVAYKTGIGSSKVLS